MAEPTTPPSSGETRLKTTPAKRGVFQNIVGGVRDWFKLDDDSQMGLRVKRPKGESVRRERNRELRIMFVDVGNAARSPVAQAIALIEGFHAESAGTFPANRISPEAVATMKETGLDISTFRPKPLDVSRLDAFDIVVSFGDALPKQYRTRANCQVWNTVDPKGMGYVAYIEMRRDLERRIRRLARIHKVRPAETIMVPV